MKVYGNRLLQDKLGKPRKVLEMTTTDNKGSKLVSLLEVRGELAKLCCGGCELEVGDHNSEACVEEKVVTEK